MKNISILIAIVFYMIQNINAQMTSGNTGGQNSNNSSNMESPIEMQNSFYLNIAFTKTSSEYKMPFQDGGYFSDPFNGLNGLGGKNGVSFEFGTFYPFTIESLNPKFLIGLKYSWLDISILPFEWESTDLNNYASSKSFLPFFIFSQKLGPSFYYEAIENLSIGANYQIQAACTFGGTANINGYEFDLGNGYENVAGYISANNDFGFNFKHSIGFDFNYNGLFAGIEFNFGKMSIEGAYSEYIYYDDIAGYSNYIDYEELVSSEINQNNVRLKFGYMKTLKFNEDIK